MSNFSVKKIKFTSKQFLNFVPKSYYSVPITLKNAPLWNFLRHQCLKCAHMSTIALTIIHTETGLPWLANSLLSILNYFSQ